MNQIHLLARLAQGLLAVTTVNANGRATRTAGVLKGAWAAWAALTTGSRAIPLGDNGALLRDLAARIAASNRGT